MVFKRKPDITAEELQQYVDDQTLRGVVGEAGRGVLRRIDFAVGERRFYVYDHDVQVYGGPNAQEALNAYSESWRQGEFD